MDGGEAASALLPRVIDRLGRAHPGLELDFTEAEPPQARQLLRAGAVDVALVFGHGAAAEEAAYSSVDLGGDATHLITPADGVLADGALAGANALAELRDAPGIAGCPQCRTHLLDLAGEAGLTPRVRFATDDYVAVQHLVAAGHAVAILPALALAAYQHPGVRAHRLPGATRHVAALTLGRPAASGGHPGVSGGAHDSPSRRGGRA